MKKLLGIIVLGFMFATPLLSQVIDLTKCDGRKVEPESLNGQKIGTHLTELYLKTQNYLLAHMKNIHIQLI